MCPHYDRLAELFCNNQNLKIVAESLSFHVDLEIDECMSSIDTTENFHPTFLLESILPHLIH